LSGATVAVLLVVPGTGEGEGVLLFTPCFGGVVDEFVAVIAMKLQNRKGHGGLDV
jgi:hypothetical protein